MSIVIEYRGFNIILFDEGSYWWWAANGSGFKVANYRDYKTQKGALNAAKRFIDKVSRK